jgi:hypothetical protein
MSMKTLVKIALMSTALAGALAITPAGAADFSGMWKGEGVDKPGYVPCSLWLHIAQTNDNYTEQKVFICQDVLAPFPRLTLKIRGRDLLDNDKIAGSMTDTEVRSTSTTEYVNIESHLTLEGNALKASLILNSPDGGPSRRMEAVLKRESP